MLLFSTWNTSSLLLQNYRSGATIVGVKPKFNVLFKMVIDPGSDGLGGQREAMTIGTDTKFTFGETIIIAVGPDVTLAYERSQVKRFEALAI